MQARFTIVRLPFSLVALVLAGAVACPKPVQPPESPEDANPIEPIKNAQPGGEISGRSAGSDPAAPDEHAGSEPAISGRAVVADINKPYAEQRDAKAWVERFEREGREVRDKKPRVLAELGIKRGMEVADIGAGTGLYTLDFARAVGPAGRVFAVDVQSYFLEHIAERAKAAKLTNVHSVQATHASPNLDRETVDLAFMCDVLHHIEQPQQYLEDLFAAVRPGGKLAVIDFKRIEGQSDAWILEHVRADPDTFRREIESAGFRLIDRPEVLEDNFFFVFERPRQ